ALVQRLWADGRFTDPLWQDVMLLLPGGLADSRAVKLHAALLDLARDACARKGCLLGLAAALVCTRNSGFPDGARKGRLLGLAAAMVVETRRLYGAMDVAARAKEMVREYEQEGATWPMRDRLLFLDMLGRLDPKGGDPRLAENGYRWVSIPGEEGEIEPFDMAWAPVTVQEYRAFVEAADGGNERWWRGAGWETPTDKRRRVHEAASDEWRGQLAHPNWPVTNVSWYEAMSYCRWRTVHDPCGRTIRLPTEAEWQWAVKVLELRTYPSGDRELAAGEAAQENRLETGVWEPSPVGAFPTGSRDGMVDLLGNVWVWCVDMWEGDPEGRVLRGGSFNDGGTPGFVVRDRRAPDSRRSSVGLRLAAAAAGTR
ncbi:MAG: SUMF1/EgtB/PvdO family nonheme iron enzyme, partial [Planctomycetes bacterium]|nr:SUMF1/EgtB/PvdO family nonheme iron enzyme [Planctomycetota bacterium]